MIEELVPAYHLNLYNTFYCDNFYQLSSSRYSSHGGYDYAGYNSGAFFVTLNDLYSVAGQTRGASLSFKLI